MSISKRVKLARELSYLPTRIIGSNRFYCIYCRLDYSSGHRHFDFTIQTRLPEMEKE